MSYSALAAVVIAICCWLFWFMAQRINKRSQAEGDLDQRLPLILDASLKPWQQLADTQKSIIDEERKEKLRAQDERESITKQLIEYATVQTQQHANDISKMREHFSDGQRRLYERVEVVEKHHLECTRQLEAAEKRIIQFENRQYNTALLTPVATVSATVPAGGLNITPAS